MSSVVRAMQRRHTVPERTRVKIKALIKRWRPRPDLFAKECLGIEPWDHPTEDSQLKVLRAAGNAKSLAVRSGHKVGKSTTAAILALWAFVCFPGARVILTAPVGRQISEVLWREVSRLYRNAKIPIGGRLYETYAKGLRGPRDAQIIGFSADNPEAFSGVSGRYVFYIVDEASGIDETIFEALEGNRAGGAWLWMFGNPTKTSGAFFDAFHRHRAEYKLFHISSENTPNVLLGYQAIQGMALREWVERRKRVWPANVYAVRVEGNFPDQASNAVIPLKSLTEAQKRWHTVGPVGEMTKPLVLGVDVARMGDDLFAIAPRRGKFMFPIVTTSNVDGPQGAGWVQATARPMLHLGEGIVPGTKKPRAHVDVIGVGTSVYDSLRAPAVKEWLDTVPVNVAESSDDDTMYKNLRSQIWFAAREWIIDGGMLPPDEELASELLSATYKFDERGRIVVEPKDDQKDRVGHSPDRGDAVCLSVYEAGSWDDVQGFRVRGV